MLSNKPIINDSKTDFCLVGSRHQIRKDEINAITLGSCQVQPVRLIRNLGEWLDEELAMNTNTLFILNSAW